MEKTAPRRRRTMTTSTSRPNGNGHAGTAATAQPPAGSAPAGHGRVDGRQAARHLGQRVLRQEPPPAGLRQPAQGAAHHGQGSGRQLARRLRRGRHPAGDLGPHRADRRQPLQGRRAGQRPGHRQEADPADLRQAALRLEVPPPADEPRPAGHRHQRRRHVRRAHHRQAGEDHLQDLAKKPAHYYEIQIDTKRNQPEILNGKGEGVDIPPGDSGHASTSPKHGIEWIEQPITARA